MKTRILLFIMLLFSFSAFSQETTDATIDKGSGILYFSAKPGTTPVNPDTYSVSEFAMNTAANPPELWIWNRTSAAWERQFAISQGDTIPTTAPSTGLPRTYIRKSTGAIYVYNGSAWTELGAGGGGGGTDDQTAVEVPFTPTGNILSSDVQSMGEELQTQIDAIQAAFGISNGAQNLGAFSGSTISDNTTTKNALQELEIAVESAGGGGGITDGDKGEITVSASGATWNIDNDIAATGLTWNDTLICDNIFGKYYTQVVQSDTFKIVGEELNGVAGCSAYVRLQANGTDPVIISGIDFVHGISSGDILASGTYEFYFESSPDGYSLEVPGAIVVVQSNDPNIIDSTMLRTQDSLLFAFSGRWNSFITANGSNEITKLTMPTNAIVKEFGSGEISSNAPTFDDANNAIVFSQSSRNYFEDDSVATEGVQNLEASWTIVIALSYRQDSIVQYFFQIGDGATVDGITYSSNGGASFATNNRLRFDATNTYQKDFQFVSTADQDVKHIIAITYDGSTNTTSAYYDGTLRIDNESVISSDVKDWASFVFGARFNGGVVNSGQELDANIYDVFFYQESFSQSDLLSKSDYLNAIHSTY